MGRIRLLSPVLANQIAAGEVVERPASVIKELVENSLDAGADRIEVEIEEGGVAAILVRDSGEGIHPEDLPAALERHATSKLATLDELERISSMGFRGEALPSIASVSRLRLVSRTRDAEHALAMAVHGGRVESPPAPAAHPVGTTVEVRDLFYNTPARRKFLRTARTEARHCETVVRRLALSRPDVRFALSHGGRSVIDARVTPDPRARLVRLCGADFAAAAVASEVVVEGLRVHGWIAGPDHGRASPELQHIFVNGRSVSDGVIRHAVRLAFGDRLAPGRFPAFVLALELDPLLVDVNVHPTKHEVRFREPRMIHDLVRRFVREALGDEAGLLIGPRTPDRSPHAPFGGGARPRAGAVRDQLSAYHSMSSASPEAAGADARAGWRLESTVDERFSLFRNGAELVLVDVRSTVEYLARERLATAGKGVSRPLLIPLAKEVSEATASAIESSEALLSGVGVVFRVVGPTRVSLRQVPTLVSAVDPAAVADRLTGLVGSGGGLERDAIVGALAKLASEAPEIEDWVLRELEEGVPERDGATVLWRRFDARAARRVLRPD